MSAEPISDDTLVRVEEKLARMKGLDVLDGRQFSGNTVAAMLARIRALEADREAHMIALGEHAEARRVAEAAVARKDEALRQVAEPRNWEEQDRARSIARAALGPWVPTHRSHDGKLVRVLHSGVINAQFTSWRSTIFDDKDGVVFSLYQSEFEHPRRVYREDDEFDHLERRYRLLTPDEARAAVEGRSDG